MREHVPRLWSKRGAETGARLPSQPLNVRALAVRHVLDANGEASANERWTSLNAALNGIYKQLQIRREMPVTSSFERDARKRLGRKGSEERAERNWGGDKGRG